MTKHRNLNNLTDKARHYTKNSRHKMTLEYDNTQ